ncbi:MAG: 2-dehydropantoate 2-reductase [Anaerolineales bacterium]|nr:2-dehydropantoate 2-reductase [Anaerolineales bacterium]
MRIAIFGTGGVGGYFGGLLANSGHEVTFIARGEHLNAIKSHGLRVKSVNGDFTIHPARATDDTPSAGPQDYVIVAVKHYQLADALHDIRPLVGSQTTLVPLLNGVDAHEHFIHAFGPDRVVGGLCSLVSMIEAPGIIRQESVMRQVVVGELIRERTDRVERIIQAWRECGVDAIHAEDIFIAMWTKFLFIASFGGVSSLSRASAGEILGCAETKILWIQAMEEVRELARTLGIALKPNVVESAVSLLENFEPTATSSMQRDVANGRLFELEAFSGTIKRVGLELGVVTPVHNTIYALLRPALDRAMRGS